MYIQYLICIPRVVDLHHSYIIPTSSLHNPYIIISTSMRNFISIALKIAELWQFKYFWQLLSADYSCWKLSKYFSYAFHPIFFHALKMTEIWLFKYFWQLLLAVNSCYQLSKYFSYAFHPNFFHAKFRVSSS